MEEQKSVLEQEVADADTCVNQINQDLENVMNKLGSASIEKTESRRQQKRKELIEKLKARDINLQIRLQHFDQQTLLCSTSS